VRVVQVTESLEIGGAERVVVVLANDLARRHSVTVVCTKRIGGLAPGLDPSVRVICLGSGEGNDPRLVARLRRELKSAGADVVHTHDWGVFLETMLAAKLERTPRRVHTVHGAYMSYPPGFVSRFKKALRHWVERQLSPRGYIVCVSDALRQHVAEEVGLPDRAMVTIQNGIEVGVAPMRSPRIAGAPRFITVGRLAAVKNVGMMLDAFARVVAQFPVATLRIVGDGPERVALERRSAELGIASQVEFMGFRSDTDALLGGADAFVLASLSEGIPMAVLEAMRAGLPVIATRVGGIPTTVLDGVTGVLVDSGDVDALARALVRVATASAEFDSLGLAGYRRVAEHFSMAAMVRSYERLYGAGTS